MMAPFLATLIRPAAPSPSARDQVTSSREGPRVRISFPPAGSLSHQCLPWLQAQRRGFRRGCEPGRDQRTGSAGHELARLGYFSLTGIDAVPPREIKAFNEKSPGPGLGTLCRGRSLARQKAALIGPIERQIEFGKTRRGEVDRLPAVQDRLD